MSLNLILLKPSGEHERLNMTWLHGSALEAELLTPGLCDPGVELTPPEVAAFANRYAWFLSGYRLDRPLFPYDALLQLNELGEYWRSLVKDAAILYDTDAEGFEDALDEIVTTVQIDIEEDHRIPYSKHRYYDTILCFKSDYDTAQWRRFPEDPPLTKQIYEYLTSIRDTLQKAASEGCSAVWLY